MGRPPYFVSAGVKKGPWTPEEDIVLSSYIEEYGPSNWRYVPMNTGLRRCSKSCRLRWTNYLRPGIKRGNFTEGEEKVIIDLQALLGNRWAAIASYLPQRTDQDIKNYWNTHLKKKFQKVQEQAAGNNGRQNSSNSGSAPKGQWERNLRTDLPMVRHALSEALSTDTSTQTILPTYTSAPPPFINIPKKYSAGASSSSIRAPTNSHLLNSDNIVRSTIHTSAPAPPPPIVSNTNNILQTVLPPPTTPIVSNSENILCSAIPTPLLCPCVWCAENYVRFSPKSSCVSSQQNVSMGNISIPNEETVMVEGNLDNSGNSNYSYNSAGGVSSETILYPDESKRCLGELGRALASIESWLFDEATDSSAQGPDAVPMNMPFGGSSGPF